VSHFELTPKAFANFSPELERSDNPGLSNKKPLKLINGHDPRVLVRSNPGLKLANAFGVKIQTEALPGKNFLTAERS
jgi:hypothetical protein